MDNITEFCCILDVFVLHLPHNDTSSYLYTLLENIPDSMFDCSAIVAFNKVRFNRAAVQLQTIQRLYHRKALDSLSTDLVDTLTLVQMAHDQVIEAIGVREDATQVDLVCIGYVFFVRETALIVCENKKKTIFRLLLATDHSPTDTVHSVCVVQELTAATNALEAAINCVLSLAVISGGSTERVHLLGEFLLPVENSADKEQVRRHKEGRRHRFDLVFVLVLDDSVLGENGGTASEPIDPHVDQWRGRSASAAAAAEEQRARRSRHEQTEEALAAGVGFRRLRQRDRLRLDSTASVDRPIVVPETLDPIDS